MNITSHTYEVALQAVQFVATRQTPFTLYDLGEHMAAFCNWTHPVRGKLWGEQRSLYVRLRRVVHNLLKIGCIQVHQESTMAGGSYGAMPIRYSRGPRCPGYKPPRRRGHTQDPSYWDKDMGLAGHREAMKDAERWNEEKWRR